MTNEERADAVIAGRWLTASDLRETLVAAFAAARAEALTEAERAALGRVNEGPELYRVGRQDAADAIRALAQAAPTEEQHDA